MKVKDGKLRYAPGESGLIRAAFDMGNFSGTVDKVVAVWLDDDPTDKPSLSLTVRVHIPVLVSMEPKTVKWELDGKPDAQTIRITMNHSKPIHVTAVESSSKAFTHEIKAIEDGKIYELVVTPTGHQDSRVGGDPDRNRLRHRETPASASVCGRPQADSGRGPSEAMSSWRQLALIAAVALLGAGATFWVKGPPSRMLRCDPATLKPDEVCLEGNPGRNATSCGWMRGRARTGRKTGWKDRFCGIWTLRRTCRPLRPARPFESPRLPA